MDAAWEESCQTYFLPALTFAHRARAAALIRAVWVVSSRRHKPGLAHYRVDVRTSGQRIEHGRWIVSVCSYLVVVRRDLWQQWYVQPCVFVRRKNWLRRSNRQRLPNRHRRLLKKAETGDRPSMGAAEGTGFDDIVLRSLEFNTNSSTHPNFLSLRPKTRTY